MRVGQQHRGQPSGRRGGPDHQAGADAGDGRPGAAPAAVELRIGAFTAAALHVLRAVTAAGTGATPLVGAFLRLLHDVAADVATAWRSHAEPDDG
ncbi:hypothetical protein AB0F81_41560 [Actinoplanes sp. NPDC024001]|uniref:hypothetical protein n=1 Tax=Actinoplanes sp. NPDC024001 TaxID=3154598 RepID=UPI003409FACB